MKIARFFSILLGILGTALMVFSIGLCLVSLNKKVELKEVPSGAVECGQALMDAVQAGDFAAAAKMMYGQPDLGIGREPAEQNGVMIWEAFLGSISYEFKGEYHVTDAGISRDVRITFLDISSVTESLSQHSHDLLTARVSSATDMAELYDQNNNFREELVAEVLSEAVVRALAEDAKTVTLDATLTLIQRDGKWWVVPDQALLTAISGGLA